MSAAVTNIVAELARKNGFDIGPHQFTRDFTLEEDGEAVNYQAVIGRDHAEGPPELGDACYVMIIDLDSANPIRCDDTRNLKEAFTLAGEWLAEAIHTNQVAIGF